MINFCDDQFVRDNFWFNLRDNVLFWWTSKFFQNDKKNSRMLLFKNDQIGRWFVLLTVQFKQSLFVIQNFFKKQQYILRDVVNKHEPREFAFKILKLIKNTNFFFIYNQMNEIYNAIDFQFQKIFIKFSKNWINILKIFFVELNLIKHQWWKKNIRHFFKQKNTTVNFFNKCSICCCKKWI